MSKRLLKNTRFKSEINSFFKANKEEILDIILFGSSIKGKETPADIDLLILYKDKKNIDLSYELKKKLRAKSFETEITDKSYKELFNGSFKAIEAILAEGYSLVYSQFVCEGLGYMNLFLFRYSLKNLNKSERMRFYYGLYGRSGQKGVLKELEAIKFSGAILLCKAESVENMKEFLTGWGIEFLSFPILIPKRMKAIF